jgi:hypothetical protein
MKMVIQFSGLTAVGQPFVQFEDTPMPHKPENL